MQFSRCRWSRNLYYHIILFSVCFSVCFYFYFVLCPPFFSSLNFPTFYFSLDCHEMPNCWSHLLHLSSGSWRRHHFTLRLGMAFPSGCKLCLDKILFIAHVDFSHLLLLWINCLIEQAFLLLAVFSNSLLSMLTKRITVKAPVKLHWWPVICVYCICIYIYICIYVIYVYMKLHWWPVINVIYVIQYMLELTEE